MASWFFSVLDSGASSPRSSPGARFSKLPVITGPVKLFYFPLRIRFSKVLKFVQLSAKETKWTSLEVRTHPTFLETLISIRFRDFRETGPSAGTLCCVLGQDTLLSHCLSPARCING